MQISGLFKYISIAIVFVASFLSLKAQESDVLIIEDGQMIFKLQRAWIPAKQVEVAKQYALDTALVKLALAQPASTMIEWDGDQWTVACTNTSEVCLSKGVIEAEAENFWEKVLRTLPAYADGEGYYQGAGYVDNRTISYGINQQKGVAIEQMQDGLICYLKSHDRAKEVRITGSFTNWSTEGIICKNTTYGWKAELKLPPGKYFYKYLVDGKWTEDPSNLLKEDDGHGGKNSVFYVYNHTFRLMGAPTAQKVIVSGSFNNWNEKELRMQKSGDQWILPLYLSPKSHTYKFIVDGNWIPDPNNTSQRTDADGNINSVLQLGHPYLFQLDGYLSAREVKLAGSFNDWNETELVMERTKTGWQLPYALAPGNYEYKYIVDGTWMADPWNAFRASSGGELNSFIAINPNHTFKLEDYPNAKSVVVTGNFTGWSEQNYAMRLKDGIWEFPLHLEHGKTTYKFIVDGIWMRDPSNPLYEPNEFQSENSIFWIKPYEKVAARN